HCQSLPQLLEVAGQSAELGIAKSRAERGPQEDDDDNDSRQEPLGRPDDLRSAASKLPKLLVHSNCDLHGVWANTSGVYSHYLSSRRVTHAEDSRWALFLP